MWGSPERRNEIQSTGRQIDSGTKEGHLFNRTNTGRREERRVGGRKGGKEGDVAKFGQECGRERSSLLMFLRFHC